MLVLKGCPRCKGDLLLVTYMDGRSANCLQCGFSRELQAPPPAIEQLSAATASARRQPDLRAHVAMRRSARLATLPSRGA
jgi:biotin synthase-related radical SAM superfamily protein